MGKKIGRTQTKLESVKDRGDLRKLTTKDTETNTNELSERGDTVHKSKINIVLTNKSSNVINDQKPSDKNDDTKREQPIRKGSVKKVTDKTEKIENQIRTYLDVEGRRCLRERYTLKLNNQKDLMKNEVKVVKEKNSDKDEKKSIGESVKSEKRKEAPNRRPIIKTITIKNDNRVYKAVTFVDQRNTTPLQVKIPTNSDKRKVTKATETTFKYSPPVNPPLITAMAVPSKVSVKEKTSKKEKRRKRVLSPDICPNNQVNRSPVTEVAKWAPSSLNDHTKPYYEAWVDTTLSAISKCTPAEKEEIYKSLRAREYRRSGTEELFYENFNDERFRGRIKIKTKPEVMRIEKLIREG